MKKLFVRWKTYLVIIFMFWGYIPGRGENVSNRGLVWEEDSLVFSITCLENEIIHIQVYPKHQKQTKSMVTADSTFSFASYRVKQSVEERTLQTEKLKVSYNNRSKTISFIDNKTNRVILVDKARNFLPIEVLGEKAYTVQQSFSLPADDAIYGLGQFQDGWLNYRGKKVKLVHANREIANPVLFSSGNYLIYWDNYSKTIFSDTSSETTFWSEVGDGASYYFVYGDSMKETLANYLHLTGTVPLLPKSAYGFWVSRERYRSFDELTEVVAQYRKRRIPMDNIVQDWQYWGTDAALWNSMEFHPENFGSPAQAIDKLHKEYKVKFALSVWPGVGERTAIYKTLDSLDVLFDVPTWNGYKVIDIYHPAAQKVYWEYLYKGLYTKGVDAWWMDATEPSFKDGLYQDKQEEWTKKAGMTYIGPFHRYLNTYSLVLAKMMYENLRKISDKRVSILTRSAFAGQQRYATITWSGDIYASWNVFRSQIPAGLNLCMTGIPYWTTDIGGFRVKSADKPGGGAAGEIGSFASSAKAVPDGGYTKGLDDPAYLELYTRWFQYGAFNPVFRIHGTEVPREIWYFGEAGTPYYDAQVKIINLRYSLLSYIYSTAWQVTSGQTLLMKPLVMDFPHDRKVYENASSFMFGDALLVHPVTSPMYHDRTGKIEPLNTEVSIYLPAHTGRYWYDFNSANVYQAGTDIRYNAPLETLPLFVKGGSIVPLHKPAQYATAATNSEMDLLIYAGADAEFVLYEDDNETYEYERGLYNAIRITWNEMKREITLSDIKGNLPPLVQKRIFTIKLMEVKNGNTRIEKIKQVTYTNKAVTLKL